MKNIHKKNDLLKAAKESLMWLENQQHLHGLTESGNRKYQDNVDNLKKAIKQAEENHE